ncbi:MAG: hypothetical protein ACKN89_12915 [Cyanobium sp.]
MVQKIDEDSRQLAEALQAGVPIIITTLQKFPFVSEQLAKLNEERGQAGQDHLPTRKYTVQTLSRLNCTHPLREDTFVLDFINKPEEIQEAFKQYYDGAVMGEEVDPDRLYELKDDLDGFGIYLQTEVDEFCSIFFAKLYTCLRHLALKMPKRSLSKGYQFDDEIDLNYYRLQKISEGSISLAEGQAKPLDGPHEVGTGVSRPEQVPLSRLIDLINERFGGELNDADQLFFDQIVETVCQGEGLEQAAKVNSLDKFRLVFNQALDALFIERMELNEDPFANYMGRPELRDLIGDALGGQVYKRFRQTM